MPKTIRFTHLLIHHSAGRPTETVEEIRAFHVNKRHWRDIAYSHLIQRDAAGHGHLKAGRSTEIAGAHAGVNKWNRCALGLCVIGYFHPGSPLSEHMTEDLYQTVLAAVCHILKKFNIPADHVLGHRDVKATACPGDWFPLSRLKADVKQAFNE